MEIVMAIIGSSALSALVSGIFGLIQARRSKQKQIAEEMQVFAKKLQIAEKDALRTQLLLMIKDYQNEESDILRLAEHYFADLEGNWVLTNIFVKWLEDNKINKPNWFK